MRAMTFSEGRTVANKLRGSRSGPDRVEITRKDDGRLVVSAHIGVSASPTSLKERLRRVRRMSR